MQSRRSFMKTSAAAVAATALPVSADPAPPAASQVKLRLGFDNFPSAPSNGKPPADRLRGGVEE